MFSRRPSERMNRGRVASAAAPSGAPSYPATLPQTSLVYAQRMDLGVTLSGTTTKTGTGGTCTLTGTGLSSGVTSFAAIVQTAGIVGAFTFYWTRDYATWNGPVTSAASNALAADLTASWSAATYTVGCLFEAEAGSMVDSKGGFSTTFASGKRPTLIANAFGLGLYGIYFPAAGGKIGKITGQSVQTTLAGGTDTPSEMFMALRYEAAASAAGTETIVCLSAAAGQALYRHVRDGATGQIRSGRRDNGGGAVITPASTGVLGGRTNYRVASSYPGTEHTITVNAVDAMTAASENAAGALTLDEMTIGGSNIAGSESNYAKGLYVGDLIAYSGAPDGTRKTAVTAYLDARYPEPTTNLLAANKIWDSGDIATPVQRYPHDYRTGDPFHVVKGTVTGPVTLTIGAVPGIPNGSYGFDKVFVYDNGSYATTLTYSGCLLAEGTQTYNVASGSHNIELWGLASIRSVSGMTPDTVSAPTRRTVIQGDSITVGREATVFSQGWDGLMRTNAAAGHRITMIGYAGRKLSEVAGSAGLITTDIAKVIARLDGSSKNIVVMTLGVNDFLNNVSSATYGTQLTNWFTELQAQAPSALGVILSPIGKSSEGPNGAGSTLTDYRTAAAAVAVTLSLTHINGGTALPYAVGDFNADGLHPNDTGHGKLDTYIRPILEAL